LTREYSIIAAGTRFSLVRLRGRQKCKFLNARWAILERVKVALFTRAEGESCFTLPLSAEKFGRMQIALYLNFRTQLRKSRFGLSLRILSLLISWDEKQKKSEWQIFLTVCRRILFLPSALSLSVAAGLYCKNVNSQSCDEATAPLVFCCLSAAGSAPPFLPFSLSRLSF
jgi:hypothetical protein